MLDRIAAPRAPQFRGGKCADDVLSNCKEGGVCEFDGPGYGSGGSHWPSAGSGELFEIVLRHMRVAITGHAMGKLLQNGTVLGSEWTKIFRREGARTTHAPVG